MKHKIFITVLFFSLLASCNLVSKEIINWMETDDIVAYPTKTHYLEEDDIKAKLPIEFERYSLYDYQQRIKTLTTKEHYKSEIARVNTLKKLEGNLYIYFDSLNNSSYTINAMPYMPIKKQDAKYLLGIMSKNLRENEKIIDVKFEKITGKYFSSNGRQTFKAIYKFTNEKMKVTWYTTMYVISSNGKTVWTQLNTPFLINFDPIAAKMIF
ncbi:hypothetical protein SCB49_14260 [unidentified eubacterium SCB49]|nr:hypothetical protein SCB49_14260 [unidentified eubacterium SCB49]